MFVVVVVVVLVFVLVYDRKEAELILVLASALDELEVDNRRTLHNNSTSFWRGE